jgi:hypothetical protein
MRKAIILAAGLALVTTSAVGQGSWRDRDDDDRRGWREDRREGRDRDEMRGRSMRDHHDDDDEGRSRAARFVLRSGEARMAVRCDDRESMRACVDAAMTLFDKVRTQQGASSTSSSPGSSSSSPGSSSSPPPPAR